MMLETRSSSCCEVSDNAWRKMGPRSSMTRKEVLKWGAVGDVVEGDWLVGFL
jgi:hypothetical protein